ncbi:MAG: autotransporter-associated beta strand repeat-containing protein [Verrucomicrobiales bacterium]|jgi:autotransporter-associated beta strand protein|nr:autotransporter-associated beta strand repeat-containing protein [Verrucomicrobiales bacterium]
MNTKIYYCGWLVGCWVMVSGAFAQWAQNDDTGPYDYNDGANWTGGIVSGTFSGTSQPGLTVTFGVDTTVNNIYLGISNTNILFRGDDGDWTLKLTGSINAPGNNGARTYAFGSVTDGQRLAIDLSGGDRTVFTAQGRVVTFLNEVISSDGASGLVKAGAGALVLTNTANTFGGKVSLSGGRIAFSSLGNIGEASALGQGGVIELSAGGNAASNTVKLQFGGDGLTVSADAISNRVITLVGSGSYYNIDNQSGHTLTLTADLVNAATGASGKIFTISGNNDSVTEISGVIGDASADGATSVASSGQGGSGASFVLRLSNTANTFSGAFTTGYDTIVEVTKLANQGAASSLGTGAVNPLITIGAAGSDYGSTLNYIGADDASTDRPVSLEFRRNSTNVIANNSAVNADLSFTNSGTWTVTKAAAGGAAGNHTLALQGTSTGTSTVSGVIIDYVVVDGDTEIRRDKTSLTVNSAGVWRLTGESTYTGSTTVGGGTLLVDGALAGTTAVSVSAGAELGGSGTINTAATVTVNGGVLVPGGDGAVGALTVGTLTFTGGELRIDIDSGAPAADLLNATAVNLGEGVAWLAAGVDEASLPVAVDTIFTVLQSASILSGHFANDEVQIGANLYHIDYTDFAVELRVIPEPSAVLLLAAGAVLLALMVNIRRRRRTIPPNVAQAILPVP